MVIVLLGIVLSTELGVLCWITLSTFLSMKTIESSLSRNEHVMQSVLRRLDAVVNILGDIAQKGKPEGGPDK